MDIEQVRDANTIDEMRAELYRLRFHEPLVKSAFDFADYAGKSAEDKYAFLAYHALRDRQRFLQLQLTHFLTRTDCPAIFVEK